MDLQYLNNLHSRKNINYPALGILLFWIVGLSLIACEGPVPTDLDRAAKVVRYMSRADVLKHSSFPKKYPNGKPSDFVKWFLSKEGRAQWPASLDNADSNPEIRNEAYEHGAPIVPRNMIFLADKPDREKGRQLVVKSYDNGGLIIVEGYGNPNTLPDLKRQWKLPQNKSS